MAKRRRRKSKLDPFLDRVGILPDRKLAELAGVTPENVRAFRKRRNIPARWRGEGEPLPVGASVKQPSAKGDAVKVVQGFEVTVETEDGERQFVVVGSDIAQAATQAIESLASKGIDGQVRGIRFLADALMA